MKFGPIWVPRPLDRFPGGEKGPRNRFPLLPRRKKAKQCPKLPKHQSPKSKNVSKLGLVPTDFDGTRGDRLPPMSPFVSPWSRGQKSPKRPKKLLSPSPPLGAGGRGACAIRYCIVSKFSGGVGGHPGGPGVPNGPQNLQFWQNKLFFNKN